MPRKKKEINKQRRKQLKTFRRTLIVAYDTNLNEHYRPHAIVNLSDLREDIPLSVIAQR